MTLKRPIVKFIYEDDANNNFDDIKRFATYYDSNATVLFDEDYPTTIIVNGNDNLFSQRLWNGDYLIFDNEDDGKTFSVGGVDNEDEWQKS